MSTKEHYGTLFPTAVVGSMPRPAFVREVVMGERMWDAEASSKAYPTRRAFVEACVPILRREVELLREAGV